MPANTNCLNFPYPLDSDRIDVAKDIERLAKAVDVAVCPLQIDNLNDLYVNVNGDTMTGMLTLRAQDPSSGNHAVRMSWVDRTFIHVVGDTLTGPLLYANTVTNNELTSANALTRRGWQMDTFLQITGDNHMTGDLNMFGHAVTNIKDPPEGDHWATSKSWVLAQLGDYVKVAGDTMTGSLTVGDPPATGWGVRLNPIGNAALSMNQNGDNLGLKKGGNADAAGQQYISFQRGGTIGSVSVRSGQSAVNFNGFINEPSDYRLKEFIEPVVGALSGVRELAKCVYHGTWKSTGEEAVFLNAHDVDEVAPWAVEGEKDGEAMQGVDYAQMVPMLIAAIGELAAKVEAA